MSDVKRQVNEPFPTPLSKLADDMLSVADGRKVKSIVMVTDHEGNVVGMSGWEDDLEAVTHMFIHLQAIMRASGKEMRIMTSNGVFIDGLGK